MLICSNCSSKTILIYNHNDRSHNNENNTWNFVELKTNLWNGLNDKFNYIESLHIFNTVFNTMYIHVYVIITLFSSNYKCVI